MLKLEALEKSSSEFQSLTDDEKLSRRIMLRDFLHGITSENTNLNIDTKNAAIVTGIMLELYLTGKVDVDELPGKNNFIKNNQKKKK